MDRTPTTTEQQILQNIHEDFLRLYFHQNLYMHDCNSINLDITSDVDCIEKCWRSFENFYLSENNILKEKFKLIETCDNFNKLAIFIVFCLILHKKRKYAFKMRTLISILNSQFRDQTGHEIPEEEFSEIISGAEDRENNFFEQLKFVFDSFYNYFNKIA